METKSFGKYELLEKLGTGATGEVYHARDTQLGRDVALKFFKPALVSDPDSFQRFMLEARSSASLFHSNIATVFDMGEVEGRYFLAMQYIDGRSLDDILKSDGPLTVDETVRMAKQIASALDYAHQQGFLHRDVKPGNILQDKKGDFFLTDFGLAKAMMSTGLTSHTGAVLGTPPYIPPEIWLGEAASPASDQYALACVVYECLSGKLLFPGENTPAIMTRHVLKGPEGLESLPATIPAHIQKGLERALSRNSDKRFVSATEFASALDKHVEKPQPEKPKKSVLPWLVPVGLITLAVLGYSIFRLLPGEEHPPINPSQKPTEMAISPQTQIPQVENTIFPTKNSPLSSPRINNTRKRVNDGMMMVYVPAGEFTMGSYAGDEDEKPEHKVTLPAYWIDQTEVTNKMFFICVSNGRCQPPVNIRSNTRDGYYSYNAYDNYPVININWEQARVYCDWAGGRLPDESEWEKAARGVDSRIYPWGNQDADISLANFVISDLGDTSVVGSYNSGQSPYGVYDMAGNVWEWVSSSYLPYPGINYVAFPFDSRKKIIRGGSWNDYDHYIRTTHRNGKDPSDFGLDIGFRCMVPE